MNKITTTIAVLALGFGAAACKKKGGDKAAEPAKAGSDTTTKPADVKEEPPPPVGTAKPNNADKHSCADWGGTAGTGDDCGMKGAAPFTVVYSGHYKKDPFGSEVPVWNITNNFDHEVSWGEISAWYYDAAGKVIELDGAGGKFKRHNHNGTGVLEAANQPFKAGETRQFLSGMPKDKLPPTVKSFEAEVTGWGWDKYGAMKAKEPHLQFWAYADKTAAGKGPLDERPAGGWK